MKKLKRRIEKIVGIVKSIYEYNFLSFFVPLKPKKIMINLTYRCNSKCAMCNIWKRKKTKEMEIEDWKKIIGDKVFERVMAITLSGGEAMMHPDFLKITKLLTEKIKTLRELNVISNGLLTKSTIEKTRLLAKICKRKNIYLHISVSLDGIGECHDFTRGIRGASEKSKNTLLKLKELQKIHNFGFGSGSLILRQNLDKVDEIEEWFIKNKINYSFQIVGFHDTFLENTNLKNNVDFGKEDKKNLFSLLEKLAYKEKQKKWFQRFKAYYWKDLYEMYKNKRNRTTPCPFLKDQLVIDCLGEVYYCLSEKSIGNFLKERRSIMEIYEDRKNLIFRKKLCNGPCLRCNSGCDVNEALAKDFKKVFWFSITGKLLGKKP